MLGMELNKFSIADDKEYGAYIIRVRNNKTGKVQYRAGMVQKGGATSLNMNRDIDEMLFYTDKTFKDYTQSFYGVYHSQAAYDDSLGEWNDKLSPKDEEQSGSGLMIYGGMPDGTLHLYDAHTNYPDSPVTKIITNDLPYDLNHPNRR